MKKNLILGIMLLGGLMFFLPGEARQKGQEAMTGLKSLVYDVETRGPGVQTMDTPLFFIPNLGQVDKEAQFYARTSRYTLWLTAGGLVFDGVREVEEKGDLAVKGLEDWQKEKDAGNPTASSPQTSSESLEREVTRLMFINSNSHPKMLPVELSQHQVNYMVGRDLSKWFTDLKTSEAVLYKNLYKHIDLKVYGIEKQVEYDWVVKPGGDPGQIRFRYEYVKGTRIDDKGDLIIATAWGEITHRRPVGYQVLTGKTDPGNKEERVYIDAAFKKTGENTYGFEVGEYDRSLDLIIDPVVVVYSTYLGGSQDDWGVGLAVDSSGCAYITAETYSTDFPVKGAYQSTFKGGSRDVYVAKFAASGNSLVYSTYLGGSGNEESEGIQVDSSGQAYITGFTSSTDFPTKNAFKSTYSGGGSDGFVTILSASGSSLAYSTYLGGSGTDQVYAIALDSSKNIYVTGGTSSTNFPVLNAYKSTYGGGAFDTFVTKIDAAGTAVYSTYLGGSGKDIGFGIAVKGGNAYLVGYTASLNFPINNEYQGTHAGGDTDCFLTKLSTTGTSLVYSTYLGGSGNDSAWGIAVDSSGSAYVTGDTTSTDFPIYVGYQYNHAGGDRDIFITKFSSIGTTLEYSTYLGGTESDAASHIALNSRGDIYITGYTSSSDFPIRRAYQTNYNGGMDAIVVMIPGAYYGELGFSTFLGGGSQDAGRKIVLDSSDNIYVVGYTDSTDFPTQGAYQNTGKGGREAFVTKLSTVEFGTLCGAVDNCQLTWTTGGNPWVEQTYDNYYDDDAAISGIGSDSQPSYLQTAVTGPGQLSFWWKTTYSSHVLKFYIDGQEQGKTSYQAYPYWVQKTYAVPDGTHTLKWSYEEATGNGYLDKVEFTPQSSIVLNRKQLTFGVVPGTVIEAQAFSIDNTSPAAFAWTATASHSWVSCTPNSGTGNAEVSVTVNAAPLSPGDYYGSITVSAPGVTNSPQVVTVTLHVYSPGQSQPPFGSFDLPDSENVRGSVPFTGWALDDIGMQSVKIYRQSGNSLVYIGDAIFVEGARPDKELPGYPGNYKAGWGYMMLTNFLPNGGNGVFTISAIATDLEGHQVTLGSKTLTIDNAHAVKPFGAIDTPAQGGTVSGNNYRDWGWALTPLPNTIPIDGSTIDVWVDGVNLGHPVYNIYRSDVAGLFPGYTNSNGSAGYYDLNTTVYTNGLHTIFWTAVDNAGNADGIGSRYFSIRNTASNPQSNTLQTVWEGDFTPDSSTPVGISNGYRKVLDPAQLKKVYPNEKGRITIEVKELDRIEVHLGSDNLLAGFMKVGNRTRPLPVGTTLDREKGIFYWQTGLAFVGKYHLVFVQEDEAGNKIGRNIVVTIKPKF